MDRLYFFASDDAKVTVSRAPGRTRAIRLRNRCDGTPFSGAPHHLSGSVMSRRRIASAKSMPTVTIPYDPYSGRAIRPVIILTVSDHHRYD